MNFVMHVSSQFHFHATDALWILVLATAGVWVWRRAGGDTLLRVPTM